MIKLCEWAHTAPSSGPYRLSAASNYKRCPAHPLLAVRTSCPSLKWWLSSDSVHSKWPPSIPFVRFQPSNGWLEVSLTLPLPPRHWNLERNRRPTGPNWSREERQCLWAICGPANQETSNGIRDKSANICPVYDHKNIAAYGSNSHSSCKLLGIARQSS